MAGVIKYSTTTPTNQSTLRKGNTVVAVGNDATSQFRANGFSSGVDIPLGGYVVYTIGLNNNPKVWVANTDNDLIPIARTLGGNPATAADAKYYICSVTDAWILDNPINNIVTDGLVLKLDAGNLSSYPEINTSFMDLSGEGDDGTLINGPTFNSNGYLDFDGVDDYIQGPIPTQDATAATLEVLYKTSTDESFPGEIRVFFIGTSNAGWSQPGISLRLRDDKAAFAARKADNSGYWDVFSGATVIDGRWKHLVGTFDTTALKRYENGILTQQTATGQNYLPGSNNYSLGGPTAYLDGGIAKARFYKKSLSQQEINQNYYQAPIVTDGLVLAMDAGNLVSYENGSTTAYSLAGSLSGSLINGVGYNEGNDGAWEFDGVDDHIQVDADGVLGTFSDWSMDAWVRYETDQSTNWMIVVDQARYNKYYKNIMVWLNNSSNAKKIAMYDGSWQYSNSTIPPNTWTHIATTTEGQIAKMYINGELDATRTFNWNITTDVTRYLGIGGTNNNPSYRMNGNIAVVKIYDKTLTAAEVAQNYNAQSSRFQ